MQQKQQSQTWRGIVVDYVVFYVMVNVGSRHRIKTEIHSWRGFAGNCANWRN